MADITTSNQDEDITKHESLQQACLAAGLTKDITDDLIGRIELPAVKEELKRTTQEALDLGVWLRVDAMRISSPWFLVAGIWGSIHSGSYWRQEGGVLWQ